MATNLEADFSVDNRLTFKSAKIRESWTAIGFGNFWRGLLQVRSPKAIIDGLDLLATDLKLATTERTVSERSPTEIAYAEPSNSPNGTDTESAPLEIPAKLPFLKAVSWQISDVKRFTPEEMLISYERGWKYRGALGEPSSEELRFIKQLVNSYGSWLATDV